MPKQRILHKKQLQSRTKDKDESFGHIFIFGYQARLYQQKSQDHATLGESKIRLIPLHGADDSDDTVWANRYDVRHHLNSWMPGSSTNEDSRRLINNLIPPPNDLDSKRFKDLDLDEEEDTFYMDDTERQIYLNEINASNETSNSGPKKGNEIGFDYTNVKTEECASKHNHGTETPDGSGGSSAVKIPFSVPKDMVTPTTQRQFEIIERTAKFINSRESAEMSTKMEITLQVKQANNPDFAFLNRSGELHPFYQHIIKLLQLGVYGYSEDQNESDEESPKSETANPTNATEEENSGTKYKDEQIARRPLQESVTIPSDVAIPDTDMKLLADNAARMVSRGGSDGSSIEFKLRLEKAGNSLYKFLSPASEFHPYYTFVKEAFLNGKVPEIKHNSPDTKSPPDEKIKAERRKRMQLFLSRKRSKKE
ncbi:hypothetical protein H4219_001992 [Mycoemilia scoparia]|uniref:SURP motif domain-containing protein n=1 Tax=Mycoemilia scoparia TaxID=417184 RepID=A0A9W7ZYW7_9FUNG|nr:hypothetical protein H4219_001992 [Mycoemilia scoparia]